MLNIIYITSNINTFLGLHSHLGISLLSGFNCLNSVCIEPALIGPASVTISDTYFAGKISYSTPSYSL